MNLKYLFGAFISIPLLPIMAYQGRSIRKKVPRLPEASGTEGLCENGEKVLKLLCIGESTIAGVGVATHEVGFSGTLAQALSNQLGVSVDWKVYARSGYTAKLVKDKILPKVKEQHFDLIVVGLGGNDAFTLNKPSRWKRDVQGLVNALRDRFNNAPVIFTNMPPIKGFPAFTPLIKFVIGNLVEILGDTLEEAVKDMPNTYYAAERITLELWSDKLDPGMSIKDFFSDGVHPSAITYQIWGREIAEMIISKEKLRNSLA
ncbi:MAG: SGNH/GDSL hydrolase family protein [Bacteroidota bacterium]